MSTNTNPGKQIFPDWLKAYIEYNQFNEAPEHLHFWTGVGVIAAALRRKVYIDQEYFKWIPNFYIVIVAEPGIATKSTTLSIGESIMSELSCINLGPSAVTWPMLVQLLAGCGEMVMMPGGEMLSMSCMTVVSGELGSLVELSDKKMVDVLTDLWDGKPGGGAWVKATKGSGTDTIENPWLNIMAATTPAWLSDNLPRAMIAGGFISRCIFITASKKRQLVAYPKNHMPKDWARQRKAHLVQDLERLSLTRGEVVLSPSATAFGESWYHDLYHKRILTCTSKDVAGYLSRKQTHAHKLAIVLAASEGNPLLIEERHLILATQLLDDVETDMPQIFRTLHTSVDMEKAERLVTLVRTKKKILKSEVYRDYFFHEMGAKEFDEVVQSCQRAGLMVEINNSGHLYLEVK